MGLLWALLCSMTGEVDDEAASVIHARMKLTDKSEAHAMGRGLARKLGLHLAFVEYVATVPRGMMYRAVFGRKLPGGAANGALVDRREVRFIMPPPATREAGAPPVEPKAPQEDRPPSWEYVSDVTPLPRTRTPRKIDPRGGRIR